MVQQLRAQQQQQQQQQQTQQQQPQHTFLACSTVQMNMIATCHTAVDFCWQLVVGDVAAVLLYCCSSSTDGTAAPQTCKSGNVVYLC
jgi:hypothetical protein